MSDSFDVPFRATSTPGIERPELIQRNETTMDHSDSRQTVSEMLGEAALIVGVGLVSFSVLLLRRYSRAAAIGLQVGGWSAVVIGSALLWRRKARIAQALWRAVQTMGIIAIALSLMHHHDLTGAEHVALRSAGGIALMLVVLRALRRKSQSR